MTKNASVMQEMLQAGLIVAGYDSREGGQVFGLPLGGTLVKVPFAIGELDPGSPAQMLPSGISSQTVHVVKQGRIQMMDCAASERGACM